MLSFSDTMCYMNRNGRSNQHFITTTSQARAARWDRIFGADTLPVLHAQPRHQQMQGRGVILAYDLDMRALHPFARRRLAAHVARRTGRDYGDVWNGMKAAISWPIDAVDCAVVSSKRSFLSSLAHTRTSL